MRKGRTHYDVLGVSRDAPEEVISAAYRAQMLSLKKHPDLGGDTEEAMLINKAYEVLSDPRARNEYDRTLGTTGAGVSAEGTEGGEERRRAPRYEADAPVSFCVGHDNNWHTARITDYSVLGVRIRSHSPLAEGEHVVIAPPNLASFALHGTIKWTRAFHPNIFERVYEAGIEVSDYVEDIEQRLAT